MSPLTRHILLKELYRRRSDVQRAIRCVPEGVKVVLSALFRGESLLTCGEFAEEVVSVALVAVVDPWVCEFRTLPFSLAVNLAQR